MKLHDKWKWAVKEENDLWYLLEVKPALSHISWLTKGRYRLIHDTFSKESFPNCGWKDSLHQIIDGELVKYIELKRDDKVMVTDSSIWVKRHFSHFSTDGKINCFANSTSLWTNIRTATTKWHYWRLPTEEELNDYSK